MIWKTRSSHYLFTDNWLTLRADTCEREDGTIIAPYYVYEFPDWVTAVPVTRDGKIVLVQQYRHALGEICIEIPGGCMDAADASAEAACARELLEETGYQFTHFTPLCVTSANPSTHTNRMHVFLATGGEQVQTQQLDGGEEINVLLYTLTEVKQLLREQKIIQSMHVTALFYALQQMGGINL